MLFLKMKFLNVCASWHEKSEGIPNCFQYIFQQIFKFKLFSFAIAFLFTAKPRYEYVCCLCAIWKRKRAFLDYHLSKISDVSCEYYHSKWVIHLISYGMLYSCIVIQIYYIVLYIYFVRHASTKYLKTHHFNKLKKKQFLPIY